MKDSRKAYIFAISAVMFWSTVATAFKLALRSVNFIQLLFWSSFFSALGLLIVILIQKKMTLLMDFKKRDFVHSAGMGLLNPFLYYIILFKAYDILPAQEAQTLNYTWPLTLVILSIIILKQKIKTRDLIAVIISFIGVIIIGTRGEIAAMKLSNPLGVSLAVGSSVIWALYWIFNMKEERDGVVKLFLNFVFGTLFSIFVVIFTGNSEIHLDSSIIILVYIGLFEMGITFVLWLNALKMASTTAKVGNLIYLSPFISLVLIHFILKEDIFASTLIGLVFIVGGIILQRYKAKNNEGEKKEKSIPSEI